jgi:type II secretory pathway pseudopilin PulG
MSRGYILVEVSIAYLLLTLALVALLPVFIMAIRAGKNTEQLQVATYLTGELLEEVRMRKWDENTTATLGHIDDPSPIGPDAGETASNKTTFDDIDDFNGWSETPARDPLNALMPGLSAYSRTVTVSYVDSSLASTGGAASDYKMVKVCTRTAKTEPLCLQTLFTNR